MKLNEYLDKCDREYNSEKRMICLPATGPGYHTKVTPGTPAHRTLDAMDYALALLQSGDVARAERACDIIEKIASLQETNPTDTHYGIWGWFLEEPAKQMAPADWNWADFIGSRLAQILAKHASQLRPATLAAARTALRHATLAIFRRNVGASYTNIAIMGGVVTAAGGELLDLPFLLDYGRTRLANVIRLVEDAGGFPEYNSPTYTRVGIEETERALYIVKDAKVREYADRIRTLEWEAFAEHSHPATGQIAGPCSRAYSDWLQPELTAYFREQTGAPVVDRGDPAGRRFRGYELVPSVKCPEHLRPRFSALPEDPHVIVRRFSKHERGDVIGTTWFTRDACLGSVNRDTCWNQRRSLLAYWKTPEDVAVCLRARMLADGRDFSPSYVYQSQRDAHTLSAYCLAYDAGSFHPVFDKPADHTFSLNDLRLRVSLAGRGVRIRELSGGRFELSAGDWRAIVHTPEGCHIAGRPIAWRIAPDTDGIAALDAVLHEGAEMRLDCRNTPLHLGFAMELLRVGEAESSQRPVSATATDGMTPWSWRDLHVSSPDAPVRFCW